MRINCGCGEYPLEGYTNIDTSPNVAADVHADALAFLRAQAEGSVAEIYAGHFLEHLERSQADVFLAECLRALAPGGALGIVVPDTYEIMLRYVNHNPEAVMIPLGTWRRLADLDDVCSAFLFSPPAVQESPHLWAWDRWTLERAMRKAGFADLKEIDRYTDPRITCGAWFQVGFEGRKPEAGA